ncbi:carboxypeptidase regulatory-like domain-containing protein [Nocardioides sp. Y6]|uniref:alpha-amylase n=1 Tax=Nocardioides malaquae TaxID=2773426 RepID=A0ABR9RVA4_9ACTN|nr:nidogen-like domain-containing protein [Nocardioides malaquae]MBE7325443.1 carboxypeptidase regulatory-like domain-containing protein [Nocardioides malaquae]
MTRSPGGGRILAMSTAFLLSLSGLAAGAAHADEPSAKPNGAGPSSAAEKRVGTASVVGQAAAEDYEWCRTNALERNDDSYSDAVPLPFPLTFFGASHEEIYVNNNGNVTFGQGRSTYTPEDLTGPTALPMIAPFFADVDTRGEGSEVVTYGASPDGSAFCVNWVNVGFYSSRADKLNSFQLILRSTQDQPGRSPGDFDITFNYDQIQWETGNASGGTDGLGGTSAAAGFTDGTGEEGTHVQLPGSLVNGALLDGGPNSLVANRQGSSEPGRYNFQVRNSGQTERFGTLLGSVVDGAGAGIANAYVEACTSTGRSCAYTRTDAGGGFDFSARTAGVQNVRVIPQGDQLIAGGGSATVVVGQTVTMDPIVLRAPVGMPSTVVLDGETGDGTVPSVYWTDDLPLRLTGCAGVANPTYSVFVEGRPLRQGLPLVEGPAGVYTATIAALYPESGAAEIRTNVPATCGGTPTAFNVYIDPSGTVTDQWGRPVAGATVTLLRADNFADPYTVVPNGSDIMSPSNRRNPDTTDGVGYFRWDVTAGWYKVKVDAPQCDSATTGAMEVPPEKIDLVIKLNCPTLTPPTATTAPKVSGSARVGNTIIATAATFAEPFEHRQTVLVRNGTALTTATYKIKPSDVNATFSARTTVQRPDYVDEGQGMTVTFTPVEVTSTTLKAKKAVSKTTLKIPKKQRKVKGKTVKVTVVVTTRGTATGKIFIKVGKKTVAVKKIKGGTKKKVTIKVKAAKLKKGKNRVKAVFSGNKGTNKSSSKAIAVRVTRR